MSRLESIKHRLRSTPIGDGKLMGDFYCDEETDEFLNHVPDDIVYLLQRLERYETTLQKITHTTTHLQAKFFAQEALREGDK